MNTKDVQAQFQMLDSYVKEFNLNVIKKINSKENFNVGGRLGFKINNIREKTEGFIGQIELINDIDVTYHEEKVAIIHISMTGLFLYNEKIEKSAFEEMLKLNGASTLSHLTRAYINSVTGLSGIPQITTPMINFVNLFKENEKSN